MKFPPSSNNTTQPTRDNLPRMQMNNIPASPAAAFDHIILFDGVCHFCSKSVHFVIKHDKHQRFKFASIQSDFGKKLLLQARMDPDDVTSFVLVTPKTTRLRSDAVLETARILGGVWHISAALHLVPRCWRDRLYHFFASRRYALFGQSDRCMVPTDQIKERFLD